MLTTTKTDKPALRVSGGLHISFGDGGRVFVNAPHLEVQLNADSTLLLVVAAIADSSDQRWEELIKQFDLKSVLEAVNQLQTAGLLEDLDTPNDSHLSAGWEHWGDLPWLFHNCGRNTEYAVTEESQADIITTVNESDPPDRYRCRCNHQAVVLPPPSTLGQRPFVEAMLHRRTCRQFHKESDVTLQQLSDTLFYSGGVLFENDTEAFGTVLKKCSPSPGARHGVELYPVVRNCEGVEPGCYHYCTQHHQLQPIKLFDPSEFLQSALTSQWYFADSSVTVFMSYVVERLSWKYRAPRAYRLALIELGHYCQNALLTGSALGLGVFSTGALADAQVEQVLQLDGVGESVFYAFGIGQIDGSPYSRGSIKLSGHLPTGVKMLLPESN